MQKTNMRPSALMTARLPCALLLVLLLTNAGGCSKPPAPTPADPVLATSAVDAVAVLQAQSVDLEKIRDRVLREAAILALRERRMYSPVNDNAVEYFLALRSKHPNEAAFANALNDLMPYTVIAAEHNITRGNFAEAHRLIAMIEKIDPSAPALPRLKIAASTRQDAQSASASQH